MHKSRSLLQHKAVNNVPCTTNNQQTCTLKIHISEIIKYTTEINITQRETIFAIKRSPIGYIPRAFLPTIDIIVLLLSTIGHPRAMAMNAQGRVLVQIQNTQQLAN
jgi:hypothetical protein